VPGSEFGTSTTLAEDERRGLSSMTLGNTQDAFFPRAAATEMPTVVAGHGPLVTDDRS
jgi:hypothetical protein